MKRGVFYVLTMLSVTGCGHWKLQADLEDCGEGDARLVKGTYRIAKLDYTWVNYADYHGRYDELADAIKREIKLTYPSVFKDGGKPVSVFIREEQGKRNNDGETLNAFASVWTLGLIPLCTEESDRCTVKMELSNEQEGSIVPKTFLYATKSERRFSLGIIPMALFFPYWTPDGVVHFDKGFISFEGSSKDHAPLLAKVIGAAMITRLAEYERAKADRQREDEMRRGPAIDVNLLPF